MRPRLILATAAILACGALLAGQGERLLSPAGSSATHVGGKYVNGPDGPVYQGGKWIEVTYSRPIKRGRDLFGSGATYGKEVNAGAPVWRAGANVTTQLKTEAPLVFGDKRVAPGEYSVFIELKQPTSWTLIISRWPAQTEFDPSNTRALWGAYGYTADKDVVRLAMKVETLPFSIDQLTWNFVDMTDSGGQLAIMWDRTLATAPFKVQS